MSVLFRGGRRDCETLLVLVFELVVLGVLFPAPVVVDAVGDGVDDIVSRLSALIIIQKCA